MKSKTKTPAKGAKMPVKGKQKPVQQVKRETTQTAKQGKKPCKVTRSSSKSSIGTVKKVTVKPKKQTAAEHKNAEAVRLAMQLAPKCVALFELPGTMYREAQKFGVTDCKLSFDYCQKTVRALQAAGRL